MLDNSKFYKNAIINSSVSTEGGNLIIGDIVINISDLSDFKILLSKREKFQFEFNNVSAKLDAKKIQLENEKDNPDINEFIEHLEAQLLTVSKELNEININIQNYEENVKRLFLLIADEKINDPKIIEILDFFKSGNIQDAGKLIDFNSIKESVVRHSEIAVTNQLVLNNHAKELVIKAHFYSLDILDDERNNKVFECLRLSLKANETKETLKLFVDFAYQYFFPDDTLYYLDKLLEVSKNEESEYLLHLNTKADLLAMNHKIYASITVSKQLIQCISESKLLTPVERFYKLANSYNNLCSTYSMDDKREEAFKCVNLAHSNITQCLRIEKTHLYLFTLSGIAINLSCFGQLDNFKYYINEAKTTLEEGYKLCNNEIMKEGSLVSYANIQARMITGYVYEDMTYFTQSSNQVINELKQIVRKNPFLYSNSLADILRMIAEYKLGNNMINEGIQNAKESIKLFKYFAQVTPSIGNKVYAQNLYGFAEVFKKLEFTELSEKYFRDSLAIFQFMLENEHKNDEYLRVRTMTYISNTLNALIELAHGKKDNLSILEIEKWYFDFLDINANKLQNNPKDSKAFQACLTTTFNIASFFEGEKKDIISAKHYYFQFENIVKINKMENNPVIIPLLEIIKKKFEKE